MSHLVVSVINGFVSVYTLLILGAVALSWLSPSFGGLGRVRGFLESTTGPYLRVFRRFVPPIGRLDFSPLVALVTLQVVGGGAAVAAAGL